MGKPSGAQKARALLLDTVPFGATGAGYKASFSEQEDYVGVTLSESQTPDSYYLPWSNKECTEGQFSLKPPTIKNFFTAQLTGCSLWVKIDKDKIYFRHEARRYDDVCKQHLDAGFELVADSDKATGMGFPTNLQDRLNGTTMIKTSIYMETYAILDYVERAVEFRIQMVEAVKKLGMNASPSCTLLKTIVKRFSLPF